MFRFDTLLDVFLISLKFLKIFKFFPSLKVDLMLEAKSFPNINSCHNSSVVAFSKIGNTFFLSSGNIQGAYEIKKTVLPYQ